MKLREGGVYRRRDGTIVGPIKVDLNGNYHYGHQYILEDGKLSSIYETTLDLISEVIVTDKPEPKEYTRWINMYKVKTPSYCYSTREEADAGGDKNSRIACVQVTFKEGDGIE